MEENLKSMKDRMSLLEEENIHLRARVSELEGNNNILYIFLNAFLIFDKQRSSGTPLSPMSHTQPSSETPLSPMSHTQPSSETPLSPMSQQPNLTHEETTNESDDETPALDTQVFSPNLTKEKETETSTPIAPKSIETPVYTPSQTQQIEREPSDDTPALDTQVFTPNLTKEEDTHAVHHTPSSPLSSLIALVIEENKNALSETETATQYFSTNQSDETPSEQNQAEENLKDTTEPTTELVSTDVSKMPPITLQTEHLQTSAIDFSETNEVEVSRLLAHFQIGAEVEILSTDDEIWSPGKVVDLKLCEGLEELTVEYDTLHRPT
ncbi:unnamed protein product [Brassica napus]|uniref:(rape) hypothetical protein n=1 Tax=Brassica napus TaxID=3708 RepID=A0A816NZR8_BRANA|nr:unnamed protein product [Brassica napus]